jgi:predicted nucleic acid-binding Zn ribbon protein
VKKQCRAIFTKARQRRKDSFIEFCPISLFAGRVVSLAAFRQLNVSG